jgi:ATP-binding cassette subfamily C protein CydC
MRNKTSLLITHRLVGLERVDEILVMQDGQIVERGRHAELLVYKGLYRRLWDVQNQILSDPSAARISQI